MMSARDKFIQYEHWPIIAVFAIAFGVRLFACLNTAIINPDGIHYIHQARAIVTHDWSSLTNCHLQYISILPIFIALGHLIFQDWVAAGRLISLSFSFAALFPLFFILRQFFNKKLSTIILMSYGLIPVFVSRSADIVRDPIFWFLICTGMLLFVKQLKSLSPKTYRLQLLFSSIFFLLSVWARIEGVIFIGVSALYLLISRSEKKIQRIIYFCLPLILLAAGAFLTSLFIDSSAVDITRLWKINLELSQFIANYQGVLTNLHELASQQTGILYEFLHQVEGVMWFVPLGALFVTILEGFFYPYVLFFFLGFIGLSKKISQDRDIGYFFWLVMVSFVALYIHMLNTWLIYNRFLSILIYPSCLLVGFGISHTLNFLQQKCKLNSRLATALLIVFILSFGLGKNLVPNHQDKIPYREAGERIAREKAPGEIVSIAGLHSTIFEWVFFYAHRNHTRPICANAHIMKVPPTYEKLLRRMRKNNVRYLFYEEKRWARYAFDLKTSPYMKNFQVIGKWRHKDTGELLLLKRKES